MTDQRPRNGRPEPRGPALVDALDPESAAEPAAELEPDRTAEQTTTPEAGQNIEPAGAPEGAPWDCGNRPPAGPAPIIEIASPLPSGPVKPLGPRRLARLQREMAEHQRQVQEAERRNAGQVDEDLLLKQQRFAELAVRAAAANEQDRRHAEAAVCAAEGSPGTESSDTGSPDCGQQQDPQPGSGGDHPEVVFPRTSTGSSALSRDPVRVDPGQLSSSPLVPHAGPETTQLHLFTGVVPVVAETHGAPGASADAAEPVSAEDAAGPEVQMPEDREPPAPSAVPAEPEAAPEEADPAPTDLEPAASAAAKPDEPEVAPAAPVRAVDAEGLELLAPQDYKQRSGALVPLLIVLAVVLAALVVVLIVFVL